jgi:hypothetical protein
VRQHRDELLGRGAARLPGGIASDLLGELGAMRDDAGPVADGLGEARIFSAEEIGLEGGDHHHAAALAADEERHADLGTDLERLAYAGQLVHILLELAGDEGFAGLEYMHHAPAVRYRQHVEPELPLPRGERLRARADRGKGVARSVVEEGVDFVGAGRLRHQVGDVIKRRLEIGRRQAQQGLQDFEQALRSCGLLIQRDSDSAERRFVSGFYAELA